MSQRWGFDLDMSAIRLMHREAGEWHVVAREPLEGSDIEERLGALIEKVDRDEPVELFLPRDQILYMDVPVETDETAIRDIGLALEGRTPYALTELEFDWERISDTDVRVAAIARETLDEATAFAEARGLAVGGFSALADPLDFPRNPDFGGAPGLLTPAPEAAEPSAAEESEPVEDVAAEEPGSGSVETEAEVSEAAESEVAEESVEFEAAGTELEADASDEPLEEELERSGAYAGEAFEEAGDPGASDAETVGTLEEPVLAADEGEIIEPEGGEAEPVAAAEADEAEPVGEVEVEPVAEVEAEPVAEVEAEPVAEAEADDGAEAEAEPVSEAEDLDEDPFLIPEPATATLYGKAEADDSTPVVRDIPAPAAFNPKDEDLDTLPDDDDHEEEVAVVRRPERVTARAADTDGPVLVVEDSMPVMQFRSASKSALDLGPAVDSIPGPPRVRTDIASRTVSGPADSLRATGRPTSRPRPARPVRARNTKRSLFVIALAAVLTIGIAAIVWAILPLGPDQTGRFSDTELAPAADTQFAGAAVPEAEIESAEVSEAAVAEAEATEALEPPVSEMQTPAPEVVAEAPAAEESVPDEAPAAQTEIAQVEPVASDIAPRLDAQIEPGPSARDTDRLSLLKPDARPATLPGALPAERSTIDATVDAPPSTEAPDTRDSVPVRSEAPDTPRILKPVKPLPLNGTFQSSLPEIEDSPAPFDETPVQIEQASLAPSLPVEELVETVALPAPTALARALPSTPPRPRLLALEATEEPAETGEETQIAFETTPEAREALEGARPPARPVSEEVLAAADAPVTDNALTASPAPRARPVAALIDTSAAIAAAYDYQAPDTSSAVAAALSPDVTPEPRRPADVAAPRPQDTPALVTMPSKANVAEQATQKDALRLSRLNLVGVFGQPSDRRALLRLPSGKIVRVKVGDRLDGGTVAQIDDSELRYRKGGRMVALRMPQG